MVSPLEVVAATGTVRDVPTGTEPTSTDATWSAAFGFGPNARRCPLRVPTKIWPFHAVGTANFEAVPMGADHSRGSTPPLGMAP